MRLPLAGVPYFSKSQLASNQRSVNLYAEKNEDPQSSFPFTYYQMPGTTEFGVPNLPAKTRCFYRTSIDTAYVVIGPTVYSLQSNGALVFVGSIADRASQVIMADNGLAVVLVDGVEGWAINTADNSFGEIIDAAFYGADYVLFLDTFFVFNRPDTNQFYISGSMVTYALLVGGGAFDPLDIAAKSGSADPIVALATAHKDLWLIGELTSEVWIGTGAADFYFQLQQGAYINHGCAAQFSVASMDVLSCWIMQNKQGSGIVVQAAGYELKEISTPAVVSAFKSYGVAGLAEAVGTMFQVEDHAFYVLSFATANKTWCVDIKSGMWAELSWLNIDDGTDNRHRMQYAAFVFGYNLIADWEDGTVWKLDPDVFTDDGDPIIRLRTFMHMVSDDYNRIVYKNFDANMQVGTSPQIDVDAGEELPVVDLSWSDNAGVTFGNPVSQSLGNQAEYLTTLSWNRLGQARDRVFKLQWSANLNTNLNGAFVTVSPSRS